MFGFIRINAWELMHLAGVRSITEQLDTPREAGTVSRARNVTATRIKLEGSSVLELSLIGSVIRQSVERVD